MGYGFLDIAITPAVRAVQEQMGTAEMWEDFASERASDRFTPSEAAFIASRDSFYMATVSETGWPYVQHRGGPRGFLKMIDERTLAFADFAGNRQYISTGNAAANDRVCLFLMDYPRRARLKIYAHAQVLAVDADPALADQLRVPGYRGRIERLYRLRLTAFDWNCPQHITPRFTESEVAEAVAPLRRRLAELEAENAALKAGRAIDGASGAG
ncbi:pyridoxamine 5'-phosphate oxidase family protein [Ancylobacter sp. A5.8]|uniref:pyridoxamine 5'-phosphate oxidase family protein n=1 Tax=Ancylobacter gelatini TaxID=2919920 RepID=UPI001F4EC76C|nr:pyridoxamine 5'-phosphate oxidase family protein [Ancylobacter gelatini]MCJ8143447.1 pyridoxamine 5'-phosphate oxidase family protein [Ancylobacter gelatini]